MEKSKTIVVLWILMGALVLLLVPVAVIDRLMHSVPAPAAAVAAEPQKNVKTGNKIGDTAPDFTLTAIDGHEISLSNYRGKNVILNFWATWCGPCRYEISSLESIHENWPESDVVVLAVACQDQFENVRSYAKMYNLTFTIPVDEQGRTPALYGVRGIPTTFFINRVGKITSIKVGPFISDSEIEERIASFN